MPRFKASIHGNRGQFTHAGSAGSGIQGHLSGDHIGAKVMVIADQEGNDHVYIYATSGSIGQERDELIAEFTADDVDKCRWCSHLVDVSGPREKYIGMCEFRLRPHYCQKYEDMRKAKESGIERL